MKNYVQPGYTLDLEAPVGGVSSGDGLMIGGLLVVAQKDAAAGEKFPALCEGVVSLPLDAAKAVAEGELLYWDDSAKELNGTGAGRFPAASAVEALGAGASATCKVKLHGHSVEAV